MGNWERGVTIGEETSDFVLKTKNLVFKMLVGWLFGVYRPFVTVFQSISGRLPERGRKKRERIEEYKNVQTTPTRTYCKRNGPLPYYHPKSFQDEFRNVDSST